LQEADLYPLFPHGGTFEFIDWVSPAKILILHGYAISLIEVDLSSRLIAAGLDRCNPLGQPN
jgi:hypothetical protein